MKKNTAKGQIALLPFPNIKPLSVYAILLSLLFCVPACDKEDPPPTDPCENNENKWNMYVKIPDQDGFDFSQEIFVSGAPVKLELTLIPDAGNKCPKLYSFEIQLLQLYTPAFMESDTRTVSTLLTKVVNAEDTLILKESFVPTTASGEFAFVVIAKDQEGNILNQKESAYFYVQQLVSTAYPMAIRIGYPYNGLEVDKGADLVSQCSFSSAFLGSLKASVVIKDEDGHVVQNLETFDNVSNGGIWAPVNTGTRGKYTITATAWRIASTGIPYFNIASNKFTVR